MTLTIGMFDGVHLGHIQLLEELKKTAYRTTVITFTNHPAEILKRAAPPLLTPSPLKLALLSTFGIYKTIALPFTEELAKQPYDLFLEPYEFKHLILGEGAAIGCGRHGTPDALRLLGLKRGFTVHTLSKVHSGEEAISSTRIRTLIQQGNLKEAELLLGRPHCFYYSACTSNTPTFALPPDGEYPVWSHSPAGIIPTTLKICDQVPELPLEAPQLVSFGPKLNPKLSDYLCQHSLAAL